MTEPDRREQRGDGEKSADEAALDRAAAAARVTRVRDGGHGGNVKSAAPPRPAPPRSRTPVERPSAECMGRPPEESKRLGRAARFRGLKVLMWSALMSVLVVGLGLLLYFTPIMSARNIVVIGLGAVTQDEVIAAAAVQPGTPLLQVDTDAVAERVAAIRRVASARVQRQYPSTLRDHGRRAGARSWSRTIRTVRTCSTRDGVDFATAPPPAGSCRTSTPTTPGPATRRRRRRCR